MSKKQLIIKYDDTPEAATLIAAFDEKARRASLSRQDFVYELMKREVGPFDPAIILGYIEVFGGEVEPDSDCPECQSEFGNGGVFVGFTPVGSFGPVCRRCALG